MADSKLSELSLDDSCHVMVAAIDFGTTYSGYAFSFKPTPKVICMNKNWGENLGFQSYKTATSVLTGPDHQFVAFGHDAEKRYTELQESGKDKHNLYRQFKMILHNKQHISRSTTVTSTSGHICPAMDIFVMAIRYLKEHLLQAVAKEVASTPDAKFVRWMITVPAIWSDRAKNFMREAAFKAGCIKDLSSRQLVIALEPEAASLYCRSIDMKDFAVAQNIEVLSFKSTTKYLVIDAGGGTIDITGHEILFNGKMKELLIANGGDWGGTQVDENFVNLLKKVLGADFVNSYKSQCAQNWLSLMGAFEMQKRSIMREDSSRITLPLPWSIASKYSEICKKNIESVLNEGIHLGVSFQNGSICLSHAATMALFEPVIDQISRHVRKTLQTESINRLSYILLVGGFGECSILQQAIQKLTPHGTKLLVPSEAQLSVVKGAISFGHDIYQITNRKARKTYGMHIALPFVCGVHDECNKEVWDGVEYCNNIFDRLVSKGDSIEMGKVVKRSYHPPLVKQTCMEINIFCTEKDNIKSLEYITDPKFTKLGQVRVDMPVIENSTNRYDREIEIQLNFGHTEILVTAKDVKSGNSAETICDF